MLKYKASDFFMTRTPLKPISDYFDMFKEPSSLDSRLTDAFADPALREAIAVASKDLLFDVKSWRCRRCK